MSSISIVEFLAETKDDFNSPTTSTFTSKMGHCRNAISALEESLDADRSALKKMKSAVKAMYNSGEAHGSNEDTFVDNLEKLGSLAFSNSKEPEPDIGSAFLKLAVFTRELTTLLKNLISNFNRVVIFPLESLLKGDLKGIKGDMKRPFDKSWKDYDTKVKQVEREKRQLAKEAGMIRNEIGGGEIAEEMEKERRMFQLQMCDYLIKANEIKTKKGVDLLQHLVDYYHAQNTFFNEGCRVTEQFKQYFTELSANLQSIRQSQDEERRQLVELRNLLRSAVGGDQTPAKPGSAVYNLHQLQGLKEYGNEKVGSLMKRSEGLRKAWQKRKCTVSDGFLTISHNNMNKAPVKLNLLTSQVKPFPEDRRIFDLVSHNRTYRFMADDEAEAVAWVSVISNSKEDALNRVFGEEGVSKEQNSGLKELTKSILDEVRNLPGNNKCCDCGAADPTWLSTNLGVLICIECSGIHRDMGVHISRIQSITLDELGSSELLIARSMGNTSFNDVMESKLDPYDKPNSSSDMEARKTFIRDKYETHRFAVRTCLEDQPTLQRELIQAISNNDMTLLLQLFAEGVDLSEPLSISDNGETALHYAIANTDRTSLSLVDFLVQNSSQSLNKQTVNEGNTPLHLCAELNKTECMKLLLRTRAKVDIKNSVGEKPIDTAQKAGSTSCEELLAQASSGKFHPIVHVDVDWNFSFMDEDDEDDPHDNSDEELESDRNDKSSASLQFNSPFRTPGPVPAARSRPVSAINPGAPISTATTPDSVGRLRPTSFKDRHRPSLPGNVLGLSSPAGGAPTPPPKPALPASSQASVTRNRSRTVAPVANLREHKRTSSDTRATVSPTQSSFPVHQGRNANVTKELENLFRAPPPLPPHNPPAAAAPMTRGPPPQHPPSTHRPLPAPVPTHEPKRDSFNESSGKGGQPRQHQQFSIIGSIQNAFKGQARTSRKPSGSRGPVSRNFSMLHPAPLSRSQSKSNVAKGKKSGNAAENRGPLSPCQNSLSSSRSLESLLSREGPPEPPDLQSLREPARPMQITAYFSPTGSADSFKINPLYANCQIGMLEWSSGDVCDSTDGDVTGARLNATCPLPSHSASFPADTVTPTAIRDGQHQGAGTRDFAPVEYSQSDSRPVTGRLQNVQSAGAAPPALPDKMAQRELPPPPLPRSSGSMSRPRRVKAIYDCDADNPDELTFVENEIILVTGIEDQEWWVGHIEHQPHRTGVFPVSFVQNLPD